MQNNRTLNTTRNAKWGIFEKIIQMVLPFVTRTLILKLIGEKYLGINGLFTSVISMLNMADLGFGAAITYSMYKPIAENDNESLCAILNFYKKIYRVIGIVVLGIGVSLMPFLPMLIKDDVPSDINIYLLFSIYLINTVLSYWLFAYKKSLLHAYHRDDVKTKISSALLIAQYAMQIFVLVAFDNYYTYVIVLPLITLLNNIITSVVTQKMFPEVMCRGKIASETSRQIKKQVSGAFIGKICGVTRNSLDSMFVSSSLGLTQVAIYGNYYYILSSVHNLLTVLTNSMVGGVGNSIVKEDLDKNYKDFTNFTFLYAWISGWFSCCMLCLYQPFMRLWVGEKLMLPMGTMVLFCVYLYVMAASDIKNVYYTARGLWWEGRYRAIIEVVVNFVLHFVGAKYFGIAGIVLATILSMACINFLYGAHILFKHYFTNSSLAKYISKNAVYFAVTVGICVVTYFVCSLVAVSGFAGLIIKALICLVVPNVLYLIVYHNTEAFASVKPIINRVAFGITRRFVK